MTVFIEISFVNINSFVQSPVNSSLSDKSSSICIFILPDEVS